VQRLFSTFPGGWPGAGLLLLRAVLAIPLIRAGSQAASSPTPAAADLVTGGAAMLLLVGLSTPITAAVIASTQFALAWSTAANPWPFIQAAALAAALAMLGPGGCSFDARLFGRREIQIPQK
jgi:putative oxidoreductase